MPVIVFEPTLLLMLLSKASFRKMLAIVAAISALLVPKGSRGAIAQDRESNTCHPIGRITQGETSNFRRGQVVCEGDVIQDPIDVEFLCFPGEIISLHGNTVMVDSALCANATVPQTVRHCDQTGISRLLCLIPKGPEEQFQLIEPDAVSANPRPLISWEEVPEAESYTVQVLGLGVAWQRTVEANVTVLSYPEEEASMIEGNAYEVIVVANRAQDSTTASRVVNIQQGEEVISLTPR